MIREPDGKITNVLYLAIYESYQPEGCYLASSLFTSADFLDLDLVEFGLSPF